MLEQVIERIDRPDVTEMLQQLRMGAEIRVSRVGAAPAPVAPTADTIVDSLN
ncbi:MAG: hypothetical protein L0Y54_01195 [Sporichthyaceae bacterium]|nr:hypothetical protein [Sporichthyaceae bacterium]